MTSIKVNLGLFCAVFFWASAFVGIRIGLESYSPGALGLLRFLIASAFMTLIYFRRSNRQIIPWMHRLQLMIIGAGGIGLYNITLNYGEISVSAGISSFIIGLMPVLTLLLSVIFYHERPPRAVYFGVTLSLFGLILMVTGSDEGYSINYGVLSILIAALVGAAYSLWQKPYLRLYHPIPVTTWIIWGGTLSMMVFVPKLWQELPLAKANATWAVVYLGVFPAALAYLAWSYVLSVLSASYASIFLYSMPILSSVLGFIILGEEPSMQSLVGGSISMLGAFLASRYTV